MICHPCKRAASQLPFLPNSKPVAEFFHDQCPRGTWCDCQHEVTQSALNPQRVNHATRKEG